MSGKGITLRFQAKGEDDVRQMIARMRAAADKLDDDLAQSGGRMREIGQSLKAELGNVLEQAADRAGSFGVVLRQIGPVGLGVAAGVGAITVALGAAVAKAREAVDEFARIKDRADELRLSTDTLQTLDFAALDLGIDPAIMDQSIRAFLARRAQAAQGEGELVAKLKETDRAFLDQLRSLASNEDALRLLADRIKNASNEQDRLRIATAAFGEAGVRVSRALIDGSDGLDRFADRAREMGLIVDQEVIQKAAEIDDQMQVAARAIDLQLKQAFIDLAPQIRDALDLALKVAMAIRDLAGYMKSLNDESENANSRRADILNSGQEEARAKRLEQLQGQLNRKSAELDATGDGVANGALRRRLEADVKELRQQVAEERRALEATIVGPSDQAEIARRQAAAAFRPPAPAAPRYNEVGAIKGGSGGADRLQRVLEQLASQVSVLEDVARAEGEAERAMFQRQQVAAAGVDVDSAAGRMVAEYAGRLYDLREAASVKREVDELTTSLAEQAEMVGKTDREAFAYAQTQRLVGRASDAVIEKLRDQARALYDLERAQADAEELVGAFGSALSRMPDIARGGFQDIGSLFEDLAMDLANIAWQQLLVRPFEEAMTQMLTSARGQGGFGGLFDLIGQLFTSLGGFGFGGGSAPRLPPIYHNGTSFVPQTGPAILQRGELVVPAGLADILRAGGSGRGVNVNVVNQAPGVEVAQEPGPDGNPTLVIRRLEGTMAARAGRGTGALASLVQGARRLKG